MKEQLHRGGIKYISFIMADIICLLIANMVAVTFYFSISSKSYSLQSYFIVVVYMVVIDILVTITFNTLNRVIRRRKRKEIVESLKHVVISFVILAVLLFSAKQGAQFSRMTIYLVYLIYYVLLVLSHIALKEFHKKSIHYQNTALLVTTAGYAREGLSVVEHTGTVVKGFFITDKTNEGFINGIPIIVDRNDATAFLCWEWINKVYICGSEHIDVPENIVTACKQMGIPIYTAPINKSFEYEVIKIRTALQKDDDTTGLSFFEGEHDIPFKIRRLYTIFEKEQNNQKGFHANKQSWHLLFCPYGDIDVMLDNGKEIKVVSLSDPSVGLMLHPSIWREIFWRKTGSVLCVAASGHYDSERLNYNYDDYTRFLQEKDWSAVV